MKVHEIIEVYEPKKQDCDDTPRTKMSDVLANFCKGHGKVARETGKSQKIGKDRVEMDGKKLKSQHRGGPISPTKTG